MLILRMINAGAIIYSVLVPQALAPIGPVVLREKEWTMQART